MKLNRRQLKNTIETIIKDSSEEAVQSALKYFHPDPFEAKDIFLR